MKFKACIFLGLLFAVLFSYINVVAEAAEDEKKNDEAKEINTAYNIKETDQYGGGCTFGCCGGRGPYGCRRCCAPVEAAGETYQIAGDGYGGGGGYGGGWGGRGGGWGGGGGGSGGGGCRFGCCGYNRWGGCRCCWTAEEARAYMDNEAKP